MADPAAGWSGVKCSVSAAAMMRRQVSAESTLSSRIAAGMWGTGWAVTGPDDWSGMLVAREV